MRYSNARVVTLYLRNVLKIKKKIVILQLNEKVHLYSYGIFVHFRHSFISLNPYFLFICESSLLLILNLMFHT